MVHEDKNSSSWQLYDEPCPFCGSLSFSEYTKEEYHVEVVEDETNNDIDYTIDDIMVEYTDIQEVWFRECDTRLIN